MVTFFVFVKLTVLYFLQDKSDNVCRHDMTPPAPGAHTPAKLRNHMVTSLVYEDKLMCHMCAQIYRPKKI